MKDLRFISETLQEKANEALDPCFANDAAFPVPNVAIDFHPGLTKREYFTAIAMQGFMATTADQDFEEIEDILGGYANLAALAADALIQRLNESGDSD